MWVSPNIHCLGVNHCHLKKQKKTKQVPERFKCIECLGNCQIQFLINMPKKGLGLGQCSSKGYSLPQYF